ncbi:hypothetical protein Ctob_004557 [Chrysochromulina tobinii]|uniref:Uncharacterized protein n=1 Tax=Chrysochromulina tobinii TaxID=1460289 RepID=A0A0M0JM45_9EUKA|nr:hypothetical protein Ctob_004557 [Chrysochromulina tobinii]|eukprot:KOO27646.1 hypothetical protein Ctob_004557 [Chrysochromulina sp. CCMP291]
MSKLRVRYGKSDEPPILICCTALPFSTVKAVALFLEGAAMFSLSRTIYDLIAADILGLRPVPFCGTPYHPAPCNPVGSAWDQAVFALIAIPVTGFAKLMFGNHLICNFIVGWAWANALSQAVVEMKLFYPAICEIGSLTTSGDCIAFDAAFAVAFTLTTALALGLVIVMIEPFAARTEINAEVDAEINELDGARSAHTSAANNGLALDAHAHSRAAQAPTLRVLGQNLVVTLSLTLFVSYLIVIAGKRHETSASRKATGMFLLIHGGAFFVGWTWLICIRDLYVHYLRLSSLLVVEAVAHAVAPTYVASLATPYSTAAKAMAILSGSTFTVVLALVFYAASRCILGAKKARDEQIDRQAETGGSTELV